MGWNVNPLGSLLTSFLELKWVFLLIVQHAYTNYIHYTYLERNICKKTAKMPQVSVLEVDLWDVFSGLSPYIWSDLSMSNELRTPIFVYNNNIVLRKILV